MTTPQCTLCGRPRNEVKSLTPGRLEGTFVCNRCATAAIQAKDEPTVDKSEDKPLPKPMEIHQFLNDYVISQEGAKKDVAIAIYNHYKRREALRRGVKVEVEISKSNLLILGPSGTGKTEIARTAARLLDVPFYQGDATKLTQAGYVGDDVESLLQGLLADCGTDVEKAEWGIIFLDEFDKLARKSGRGATGYRDVTGEGVQQALLKMVEGTRMPVPRGVNMRSGLTTSHDMIDTSNILFICAGSFAGIEEVVRQRLNQNVKLGFGSARRTDATLSDIYQAVDQDDILEFGIIPELLGRLPIQTTTLPLSEQDIVRILVEPKNSLIKQFKALFELDGIQLDFEPDALLAIAAQANKSPTGARALRGIVERVLKPYSYLAPSDPTIEGILITRDAVESGQEASIKRRKAATA